MSHLTSNSHPERVRSIAVALPAFVNRSTIGLASPESWVTPLLGLLIVSVVPAIFWTLVLSAVLSAFGIGFSTTPMMAFASGITLFLAAVCATIISRA